MYNSVLVFTLVNYCRKLKLRYFFWFVRVFGTLMSTLLICAYLKRAINLSTEKKRPHNKWKIWKKLLFWVEWHWDSANCRRPQWDIDWVVNNNGSIQVLEHFLTCQRRRRCRRHTWHCLLPCLCLSLSFSFCFCLHLFFSDCDLRFTSFVFSLLDAKWVLYHIVIYCYMLRCCDRLCTEISDLLAVALGRTMEAGLGGCRLA